ncbi:MAG: amino acid-binding protein [Muribaculaceae bacterium]|nr:amino acid-binding protein [Muribaculaceae bacterium]
MTIKQLSIFIENKGGTLIKVLDLLSKANIQIIASTIADTKDYGIYRVLCNNPSQAYSILKDAGINVQLADVIALSIDDEPGHAANAIKTLSDNGISILYMYSFLWRSKGVLVFRADPAEKAKETIMLNKLSFLTEADFA